MSFRDEDGNRRSARAQGIDPPYEEPSSTPITSNLTNEDTIDPQEPLEATSTSINSDNQSNGL